ncbi:hypothetical protein [Micromonospora globbae]|uniref:hypothetical protein n=1 Tax=Micromonospora globbae TaxID=1894969 RepID=UPI003442AB8C|nr:hypothetical protein OH732_15595 [Micromonospora globbae]
MPETDRTDSVTERPDGVTDPLLWKLALEVADAHEPDGEGGCRNLLCAGEPWPCTAWNNAQRALRAAQSEADGVAEPAQDAPTGWSAAPVVPAARRAATAHLRESTSASAA